MDMQLQASKAALCAVVLLLAILLALSGVMLGGMLLAGQTLWERRVLADVESRPPCGIRGGGPISADPARAVPALGAPALNSSHTPQDLTLVGETPC